MIATFRPTSLLLAFIASSWLYGQSYAQSAAQNASTVTKNGADLNPLFSQGFDQNALGEMAIGLREFSDKIGIDLYGPEIADQLRRGIANPIYDPLTMKAQEHFLDNRTFLNNFGVMEAVGGDVSGGGSVVRFPERKSFLVDFVMVDPEFEEKNGYISGDEKIFNAPLTPENILLGLEINLRERLPIPYGLAQSRLELWKQNSPDTVAMIQTLMDKMSWRATVLGFRYIDDRYFPETVEIDRAKIPVTSVSAVVKGSGVFFIASHFDSVITGQTSRAGLLIHEVLRTIKIEFNDRLSDEVIQNITALIMLKDPQEYPAQYLDRLWISDLWSNDEWYALSPVAAAKTVIPLCRNSDSLIAYSESLLPSFQLKWNAQSLAELKNLDAAVRPFLAEYQRQRLPSLKDASIENLPARTLNFWLRHVVDALQAQQNQDFISPRLIPLSPTNYVLDHQELMQPRYWTILIDHVKRLRDELCVKGAISPSDKAVDFVLYSQTLVRLSEIFTGEYVPPSFGGIFSENTRGLTSEQKEMVEQVYREATGTRRCPLPPSSSADPTKPQFIYVHGPGRRDCPEVPKIYFKDKPLPKFVLKALK